VRPTAVIVSLRVSTGEALRAGQAVGVAVDRAGWAEIYLALAEDHKRLSPDDA